DQFLRQPNLHRPCDGNEISAAYCRKLEI
ncbi:uncharacterized protein METZ01_LOCUS244582, partial [marine metagenome]